MLLGNIDYKEFDVCMLAGQIEDGEVGKIALLPGTAAGFQGVRFFPLLFLF